MCSIAIGGMPLLELDDDDMLNVSSSPTDIYYNHDTVTIPVPFTAWGFFLFVRPGGYEGQKGVGHGKGNDVEGVLR